MNSNEDMSIPSYEDLLQGIGIEPESLTYRHAEKMPLDMLESTFVAHPYFDEFITFENSAVLLAEQGGGKTTNRRWLELKLKKEQQDAIRNSFSAKNMPFVVVYTDFEMIVRQLPDINLSDHRQPLMQALARTFIEFIDQYPNKFLQLDKHNRDWWWAFVNHYMKYIIHDLQTAALVDDWQSNHEQINLFINTGLIESLNNIQQRLSQLGFNRFYILIDGIDGYTQTIALSNLEKLVGQLVDAHDFCSYPGRAVKFFLPTRLEAKIKESNCYLSGRLEVIHIHWADKNNEDGDPPKRLESLLEFLELRLGWKNTRQASSLQPLCSNDLVSELKLQNITIEEHLALLALRHSRLGPPRALLTFVEQLLKIALTQDKQTISLKDWQQFKVLTEQDIRSIDLNRALFQEKELAVQKRLIDLLTKLPNASTYHGRSGLLFGISSAENLSRDENNMRGDLELIVKQLNQIGSTRSGSWPILMLIENAKNLIPEYMIGMDFEELARELLLIYKGTSR